MATFYKNLYSNAGATAIGSAIQFCLILSLPHWLSIDVFAAFLTAVAIVGVGEMGSDLGCRIWATKQFALTSSPKETLLSGAVAKGFYSSILAFIVMALPFNMLNWEQAMLTVCVAVTQPSTDPLLWYLRGKERLDIEAVVELAWRSSNAVLIVALAFEGAGLTVLLLAWLSINIFRMIAEWYLPFIQSMRKDKFHGKHIWRKGMAVVRLVFPIGLAFLLMAMYQRLGVLLLGEISDAHTVALYGVAFTLIASAGFVATSITVSTFPLLVRAVEEKKWQQVEIVVSRKLMLIMAVFIPACILGMVISPWVISSFYPKEYMEASAVMLGLLPGLYISTINLALKYLMNALNLNWIDAASATIGIVIFSGFLTIYSWDSIMYVAGWAWGLGEFSIFLVKWAAIRQKRNLFSLKLGHHLFIFLALFGSFWWISDDYSLWMRSFY